MAAVANVLCSSFGCMLLGLAVARLQLLTEAGCGAVAKLYAKLVFPTMVFSGVARIDLSAVDPAVVLVAAGSKAILAALVTCCGVAVLRADKGRAAVAHAAAWAMAATHSFDVTLGVPLARALFPGKVDYLYLNQTAQLVLINPPLLILMQLGGGGGGGGGAVLRGIAREPLVVMTVLGLACGRGFGGVLPPPLAALSGQVAAAGPLLGNLALGFAMARVGGTTAAEARASCALCAAKLGVMPCLYVGVAALIGCDAPSAFLVFLGSLPASASVYSLALVRDLSPRVIGPLVPASILLSVASILLPPEARSAVMIAAALLAAGLGAIYSLRAKGKAD